MSQRLLAYGETPTTNETLKDINVEQRTEDINVEPYEEAFAFEKARCKFWSGKFGVSEIAAL